MERKGIAVVDDDNNIRNFLNDFLMGDDNYAEISFENGELAWQFMEECGDLIDLVITDYAMPGMNGIALLRKVKEQYPGIKVIVMSGMNDIEELALNSGADAFFKKPFKLEQMQEAVHELLL